jgi:hypothetical protein
MLTFLIALSLTTPWEACGEVCTPRHAETVAFCQELAAAYPKQLSYNTFGVTLEGRALPLLVADARGRFDPPATRPDPGRAVVMIQACIHAGESCGKDAGLLLLRDLLRDGGLPPDVTILFLPIFNADGHERFTPHGRINQNGPQEMGWRTTAQNLNLNRDYLKADAPEMRAWLRLWTTWLPDLLIDTHATDGADYQYILTYILELGGNLDAGLVDWNRGLLAAIEPSLAAQGIPIAPYVTFVNWHDPRSGLVGGVTGPRFSQGYAALQNRPGLLIEAHMLKPYPVRVRATAAMLREAIAYVQQQHVELTTLARAADATAAGAALRTTPFPLTWRATGQTEPFRFLGYAYEEVASEISGGSYFRYHPDRPETFTVDWQRDYEPEATVDLPEAYLVPPAWDDVIARLEAHGVQLRRLRAPVELTVRSYRFRDVAWQAQPSEGRHPLTYTVEPVTERRTFPAGTAVIDVAQRAARVAVHALEPQAPDALVRWGFFDAVFSQVEYVENYVIEPLMRDMVAAEPALLDSLAADPRLAGNPEAIRHWFYARTPYFDQKLNLYPVGLLDDRDALTDF